MKMETWCQEFRLRMRNLWTTLWNIRSNCESLTSNPSFRIQLEIEWAERSLTFWVLIPIWVLNPIQSILLHCERILSLSCLFASCRSWLWNQFWISIWILNRVKAALWKFSIWNSQHFCRSCFISQSANCDRVFKLESQQCRPKGDVYDVLSVISNDNFLLRFWLESFVRMSICQPQWLRHIKLLSILYSSLRYLEQDSRTSDVLIANLVRNVTISDCFE